VRNYFVTLTQGLEFRAYISVGNGSNPLCNTNIIYK
jgi:hypothetical protein